MQYAHRLLSFLLCASAASPAEGQQPGGLPSWDPGPQRITVVVLDTGVDRMSDSVADLTRAELLRRTTRQELDVVSNKVVTMTLETESPPHWSHDDYRELAKLVRTMAMVDVLVLQRSPRVMVRAVAHYLSKAAAPDTLPLFVGRSDSAVAEQLARHLLSATVPRATRELAEYVREWRRRGCAPGSQPYFEFQVDETASFIVTDSTRPRPSTSATPGMRAAPPTFLAQFVVDRSGRAVPGTLKFLSVPSPAAADSARAAIGQWRFRPARLSDCNVPQMVQVELHR